MIVQEKHAKNVDIKGWETEFASSCAVVIRVVPETNTDFSDNSCGCDVDRTLAFNLDPLEKSRQTDHHCRTDRKILAKTKFRVFCSWSFPKSTVKKQKKEKKSYSSYFDASDTFLRVFFGSKSERKSVTHEVLELVE